MNYKRFFLHTRMNLLVRYAVIYSAHVGNPCGHTFCGECGWKWHVENGNKGCPCCRGILDQFVPMIPNIAMDNTVEKHVKALALSGIRAWEPEGPRFLEWDARKQ
ncbi:hypothetical protein GALMADRAFT_291422 [Galerina marginata CBS 339.88]|uniref:RING-type domain-containing protein n=1 Tax=Galerina marginata (strain CBS 339.88) TaxID=685588 RepID=A0A067TXT6_GALM3|nr:hypothetical protein GALMADRAFT_291422 [Galerina marginata CBS 339.88]